MAHKQFFHGEFDGARHTIRGIVCGMPKDSPGQVAAFVFGYNDEPFQTFFINTVDRFRDQLTAQAHFHNTLSKLHCRLCDIEDRLDSTQLRLNS